jgi:hypothetical protein
LFSFIMRCIISPTKRTSLGSKSLVIELRRTKKDR